MGLLHDAVNLLNLDGTLIHQKNLLQFPVNRVDVQNVRLPSFYGTPWALKQLDKQIRRLPDGITLIGSGNYHYVSWLLLSKIQEPFTLLLIDRHTDMKESGTMISCGSWVLHALRQHPKLQKVVIVGPEREKGAVPKKYQSSVSLFPCADFCQAPDISLARIEKEIRTPVTYISIDKDVLHPADAVTNWDQGEMPLRLLLRILQRILGKKQVVGVDVCGEWPASPAEQLTPRYREAVEKNERANFCILRTLLDDSLYQRTS